MQKAWNIPSMPVYSLASYNENSVNMNICTYVTPVSMRPKLYAIGIYENTQTLLNIENSDFAVLQLLHISQSYLIKKLGQTSGKTYNKQQYLEKKNELEKWMDFQVLRNTSARFLLHKIDHLTTGDHTVYIFKVDKSVAFNKDYLHLNILRDKKIIRA